MKKLLTIIAFAGSLAACNNSADSKTTGDSTIVPDATDTGAAKIQSAPIDNATKDMDTAMHMGADSSKMHSSTTTTKAEKMKSK